MFPVKIDGGASKAGCGEDSLQLGSGASLVGDCVGVGGGYCSSIADESDWLVVEVGVYASVACYAGDEGVGNTIGGHFALDSAYVDKVVRGVGAVTLCFDVDHLASPQAGVDGVGDRCGVT